MDSYLQNIIEAGIRKSKLKKKKEVEEVVDGDGAIIGSKVPLDVNVKTITSKSTTDDVVKTATQTTSDLSPDGMGKRGYYQNETDLSSQLGYEETLGKDLSYDQAKQYFMQDLGFDEVEANERLEALGYTKKKVEDKVRLIEEPSQYLEEIIDDVLRNRVQTPVSRDIDPILQRQLRSLRDTLEANGMTIEDVIQYLQ